MSTARAFGAIMLVLELIVVFLGALWAQWGPQPQGPTATTHTAVITWVGFGIVALTYALAIGGLGSGRGGCLSWVGQIATLAYALYVGGVMPWLMAVFVVLWYFAIKVLGPVMQGQRTRRDGE